jgi:formyltetrahydrofolate synthetase
MSQQTDWKVLSERTLIPISAISLVVGASMWLTSVWKQGEANAAQIQEMKANQAHDNDRIYDQLEKINEKLDRLIEKK